MEASIVTAWVDAYVRMDRSLSGSLKPYHHLCSSLARV